MTGILATVTAWTEGSRRRIDANGVPATEVMIRASVIQQNHVDGSLKLSIMVDQSKDTSRAIADLSSGGPPYHWSSFRAILYPLEEK